MTWVAPRAGAWIETAQWSAAIRTPRTVAPRAGAWIETRHLPRAVLDSGRRPSRGGVDRNFDGTQCRQGLAVAPRAGAWIETPTIAATSRSATWSPLARGRGSKPS